MTINALYHNNIIKIIAMKPFKSTPLLKKFLWSYLIVLFLTSCNSEDSVGEDSAANDMNNAKQQVEIDQINETVNDLLENAFYQVENSYANKKSSKKNAEKTNYLPECVTVTAQSHSDNTITATVDFGEGCTTYKSNFLEGKIIMEIEYNKESEELFLEYRYENFYFNHNKIEGEQQKTHIKNASNQNPIANIYRDITITWENNTKTHIVENRVRECIEGHNTSTWQDNVYLISGTRTTIHANGKKSTLTVIEPLKKDMDCKLFTQGILEIKNKHTITLDYGDGTCDNKIEVIIAGFSNSIAL